LNKQMGTKGGPGGGKKRWLGAGGRPLYSPKKGRKGSGEGDEKGDLITLINWKLSGHSKLTTRGEGKTTRRPWKRQAPRSQLGGGGKRKGKTKKEKKKKTKEKCLTGKIAVGGGG